MNNSKTKNANYTKNGFKLDIIDRENLFQNKKNNVCMY